MESKATFSRLLAILIFTCSIGCKREPIVPDPPDPPTPPVTYPDCSHSFTEPALDTNSIWDIWGWATFAHYQGFEIVDFSFNPNNPNEMMIGISLEDDVPGLGIQGEAVLLHYNLCTGEKHVIHIQESITSVDWADSGKLLISSYGFHSPIATLDPDGSNFHEVGFNQSHTELVEWLTDSISFLTRGSSPIRIVDTTGVILNDHVAFPSGAMDVDVMPNGKIAYNDASNVGIFNLADETVEIIEDQAESDLSSDVAYSALDHKVLWTADSSLYSTDIASGQRTTLATGFFNRSYSNVRASKNGYIAYVARILSYEQSQHDDVAIRTELRFINADGTDERRLVLDFE